MLTDSTVPEIGALKHKLGLLRHENLESAGFDEKLQMMGLLDIKVYPSEDLKTVRIKTGLGIGAGEATEKGQDNCGKVLFVPPNGTIPRTPPPSQGRVFSKTRAQ